MFRRETDGDSVHLREQHRRVIARGLAIMPLLVFSAWDVLASLLVHAASATALIAGPEIVWSVTLTPRVTFSMNQAPPGCDSASMGIENAVARDIERR